MAGEIDKKVLQRTRDTLGKIIKKPPLTDKLLSRPPFRYLHDIIMEVSKATGFFKGLYSDKELDAKGDHWDRDSKISFLTKAMDVTVFTTATPVRAKASKIVAGQEPEKTNEFLQVIGIAILKKLDSSAAIKKVLHGEKPSPPSEKKKHKEPQEQKKPEEKTEVAEKVEARKAESKRAAKGAGKEQEVSGSSTTMEPEGVPQEEPPLERPRHRPGTRRRTRDVPPPPPAEEDASAGQRSSHPAAESESSGGSTSQLPERPSSAKGHRTHHVEALHDPTPSSPVEEPGEMDTENGQQTASASALFPTSGLVSNVRKQSGSARPPAPKVVRKQPEQEDISRVSSGQTKAPPVVILDQTKDDEEEEGDEDYVVGDQTAPALPSEAFTHGNDGGILDDGAEGALTRKLKERLKEGGGGEGEPSTVTTITEAQRRREREMVKKEVEKLQKGIQTLCQSTNPLGKIMDYVQEDLDSMEQELEMWRKENLQHADSLRREERITEEELGPLKAQLAELDARIKQQTELINAAKASVLRNDERQQLMLTTLH